MISDTTKWFLNKATHFGDPLPPDTIKWLQAVVNEAEKIDPATAEMIFDFADCMNPYSIAHDEEDSGCVRRTEFARNPGSDIWVWFGDLPEAVRGALRARPDSKYLTFPYGLPGWPSSAKEEAEMTEKYSRENAERLTVIHTWDPKRRAREAGEYAAEFIRSCKSMGRILVVYPKEDGTEFERVPNDVAWITGALLAGHAIGGNWPDPESPAVRWDMGTLDDILAHKYSPEQIAKRASEEAEKAEALAREAEARALKEAEQARREQAREDVRIALVAVSKKRGLAKAMEILASAGGAKGLAYLAEDKIAAVIAAAENAVAD